MRFEVHILKDNIALDRSIRYHKQGSGFLVMRPWILPGTFSIPCGQSLMIGHRSPRYIN
jgi:hypothetical protein